MKLEFELFLDMAEIRLPRLEQGQTKIKTVPIAVTAEGFWCCPSPTVFQKTLNKTTQNPVNKPKSSLPTPQTTSLQRKQTSANEKKASSTSSRTGPNLTDEQRTHDSDEPVLNPPLTNEKAPRPKPENPPRKVTIEFGEAGTSDLKIILLGKQGLAVKLSVHRGVLMEHSSFFASRISEQQPVFPCLEIDNCEDVEIYVETIGLMYCKELKPRLIKQSVPRVLRILKVINLLNYA